MKLKSLEIKGFKSFADRIVINFNDGVTGVVGPNGCGKSNVVDAMRWVLGEQKTKALRSEKMENVIFNGTQKRKAGNIAEVSLLLENTRNLLPTAYNEVRITRKLYRSGESEYQLNNVNCRLKDITNLFLDTGIGSDSYAIMELKMIDEILNDKDDSRRNLFEEASGVAKYKKRKKETLVKLDETQRNLDRVEDLLFELEKNLKTLQAQASRTEKYYKLKDIYKLKSLDLSFYTLQDFRDLTHKLEKNEQLLKDKRSEIEKRIAQNEAHIERLKLDIVEHEGLLASRQKATNKYVEEIRSFETEKKLRTEKLRMLEEREQTAKRQLQDDKSYVQLIENDCKKLRERVDQMLAQVNEADIALQKLKTKRDQSFDEHSSVKAKVNELRAAVVELQNTTHSLEKNAAINKIQVETLRNELARNASESDKRLEEVSGFTDEIKLVSKQLELKTTALEKLQKLEAINLDKINNATTAYEQSREKLSQFNRKHDSTLHEYNLTKSLVENLEGYPESLRFLTKHANQWTQSIHLLSDVITCKPEFKSIIEYYLEPYLNLFVTNSSQEALKGIDILASSSRGRAGFIFNHNLKDEPRPILLPLANCTPAIELVDYDNQYQGLVNYLLGNVYIVEENEQQFFELAELDKLFSKNKLSEKVVFLSKSGKYVYGGVMASGGSLGLFEGKRIGRKKNLESLKIEVEKLDKALKAEQSNYEKLQKLLTSLKEQSLAEQVKIAQNELNRFENDNNVLISKKEQFEKFLANSSTRKDELLHMQQEQEHLLLQNNLLLEDKKKSLDGQVEVLRALDVEFARKDELYRADAEQFNLQNIKFIQLKNGLSGLEKELEYKNIQIKQYAARIASNEQILVDISNEIGQSLGKGTVSEEELVSMYEQKTDMEAAVTEAEQAWHAARNKVEVEEQKVRTWRNEKELEEENLVTLKDQITAIKFKESALVERLSVEFDLDSKQITLYEPQGEIDKEKLRQEVEQIKKQLDNFGSINPMAIEAYNEIQERYGFITIQKKDLIDARQILLDTMAEIDATAKEKFLSAFDAIRTNFKDVFRTLFTEEDTCDLVLTNADDPLESHINIIARPKGKRPLTINQLSGGEKTLTATALLFGIYLYKPAPFCIFDEVDAPLDDQNIDKFNNMIGRFSSNSQFIIVTHNKKTMSSADVIYGITMAEQGVSMVVPVDMQGLN